mmetsp:Transcript_20841/g.22292  ORF Transcript_20841/g.22292 Transcript_20841/m.22292 type:complete len:168 (-) Transcript_20841:43-546(-)
MDRPPSDCFIPLAQWAKGADLFAITHDLSIGVALGRAMGIQAVAINAHYTDGEYEDDGESYKMATDGIKVYYTTDLRDYTSLSRPLINVGFGHVGYVIVLQIWRLMEMIMMEKIHAIQHVIVQHRLIIMHIYLDLKCMQHYFVKEMIKLIYPPPPLPPPLRVLLIRL